MATKLKSKSNVVLMILSAAALVTYGIRAVIDVGSVLLAVNTPFTAILNLLLETVVGVIPFAVMFVYALVRGKSYATDVLLKVFYVAAFGWLLFTYRYHLQMIPNSSPMAIVRLALPFVLCAVPMVAILCNVKNRWLAVPLAAGMVAHSLVKVTSVAENTMLHLQFENWVWAIVTVVLFLLGIVLSALTCATLLVAGLGRRKPVEELFPTEEE